MPKTIIGNNGNQASVGNSQTISLSFFDESSSAISVQNTLVDIWIPRSNSSTLPVFEQLNLSVFSNTSSLFTFGFYIAKQNVSLHFNIISDNSNSLAYILLIKFSSTNLTYPILNETFESYDSYQIFCTADLKTELNNTFYAHFSSNTGNAPVFVGYALREIPVAFCANRTSLRNVTFSSLNLTNSSHCLSGNVSYRFYTSSCNYIDKSTAKWLSAGVQSQPDSNSTHTHCISTHLTDFAGGDLETSLAVLPEPIDFSYVFAHASFDQNKIIYSTVIAITALYVIMMVLCGILDKRDDYKRRIFLLEDNSDTDLYFYEMIVFTGNRFDAGTKSKVKFNLSGSLNDCVNRKLIPTQDKNRILERASINTFVFSTNRY